MSAACRGGTARTLGAPFVNNQIDPALYNPISLNIMSMLPLPDPALDPDGCGRYPLAAAQQQQRSAVHRHASITSCRPTSASSSATSSRTTCTRPPGIAKQAEPARDDRQRPRHARPQHTISSGLDYVVSPHLVRVDALFVPAHGDVPRARRGRADLDHARREDVGVHDRQGAGPGLPAAAVSGARRSPASSTSTRRRCRRTSTGPRARTASRSAASWTRPHPNGDGTFQANGNMGFSGIYHQRHHQRQRRLEHGRLRARLPELVPRRRQPDQQRVRSTRSASTWPTCGASAGASR